MTSRRGWWLGVGMAVTIVWLGVPVGGQRAAPGVAPLPSFSEPAISPDRSEIAFVSGGDVWTVPAAGGEARLLVCARGDRVAADLFARREAPGLHLGSNGRRRYLRPHVRDRRPRAAHLRRRARPARRLVARWRVDLLLLDQRRHRRHERPLPRARAGGHADAGQRRPLQRRVLRRAVARRPAGGVQRARKRGRPVVAPRPLHLDESEIWLLHDGPEPRYEQLTKGGAKQLWPMWSADGKTLFYVSDRAGQQNIWVLPIGGGERQVTQFTNGRVLWPTISVRRPDDRLRARLRGVVARHGERQGGPRADHAARGALLAGDRARVDDQRLPGSRAVAGRQEGGIRRPRRDLGGGRPRRRRRRPRDADLRARVPDRMAPRQQADRLRLGARRHRPSLHV